TRRSAAGFDGSNNHTRLCQELFLTQNCLVKNKSGSSYLYHFRDHKQLVINMGGGLEVDLHGPHGKGDAVLGQLRMADADIAQKLCAAALEELEIGRVIDIAREIGVFVIDADRESVWGHALRSSWMICA